MYHNCEVLLTPSSITPQEFLFLTPLQVQLKDGKVVGTYGTLIDTSKDILNDICTKDCLRDMVSQMKNKPITIDVEHESWRRGGQAGKWLGTIPVAKVVDADYVENGMNARIDVKDSLNTHSARYDEVAGSIQDGFLNAYSIAYVPTRYAYKAMPSGERARILDKVDLLNITYTGTPVNPNALMKEVMLNSLEISKTDDCGCEFKQMSMEDCMKEKTGKGMDETEAKTACAEMMKKPEAKAEYPWEQCMADAMKEYGSKEKAEKVCGAIRSGTVQHKSVFLDERKIDTYLVSVEGMKKLLGGDRLAEEIKAPEVKAEAKPEAKAAEDIYAPMRAEIAELKALLVSKTDADSKTIAELKAKVEALERTPQFKAIQEQMPVSFEKAPEKVNLLGFIGGR